MAVKDWHQQVAAERRAIKARALVLAPEPTKAHVSLTQDICGEIRVKTTLPRKSRNTAADVLAMDDLRYSLPLLVSSSKVGEHTEGISGRGVLPPRKRFTGYGRRTVKNAVAVVEKLFGKRCTFITITLAGSTDQAMKAIAMYSSVVIDRLKHWIEYWAPGSEWVYVWEWQKRGALHLHVAVGNKRWSYLAVLNELVQKYVHDLLVRLSNMSGVDWLEKMDGGTWRGFPKVLRSRGEWVRDSIKRYLGKYLSKGNAKPGVYFPSTWWGASAGVRRLIGAYRRVKVVTTPDWNKALSMQTTTRQAAILCGAAEFNWSERFAPHNMTTLIMPRDGLISDVFDILAEVMNHV